MRNNHTAWMTGLLVGEHHAKLDRPIEAAVRLEVAKWFDDPPPPSFYEGIRDYYHHKLTRIDQLPEADMPEVNSSKCKARQYSDQMQCQCGLGWDMNDPDPPVCPADAVGGITESYIPAGTPTEPDLPVGITRIERFVSCYFEHESDGRVRFITTPSAETPDWVIRFANFCDKQGLTLPLTEKPRRKIE